MYVANVSLIIGLLSLDIIASSQLLGSDLVRLDRGTTERVEGAFLNISNRASALRNGTTVGPAVMHSVIVHTPVKMPSPWIHRPKSHIKMHIPLKCYNTHRI